MSKLFLKATEKYYYNIQGLNNVTEIYHYNPNWHEGGDFMKIDINRGDLTLLILLSLMKNGGHFYCFHI